MLRCFVLPHVKEMTRLIQARGASVRPHCHGKMRHMLDMIRGTDGDGIDPCEPSPDGARLRTNPTAYHIACLLHAQPVETLRRCGQGIGDCLHRSVA